MHQEFCRALQLDKDSGDIVSEEDLNLQREVSTASALLIRYSYLGFCVLPTMDVLASWLTQSAQI